LIYLIGEVSNGAKKLRDARARGWGRMMVDRPLNPLPGEPWAIDNGAYRAWRASENFPAPAPRTDYDRTFGRFAGKLPRVLELIREGRGPLFAVAPDLPADAGSLEFTIDWMDRHAADFPEIPFYLALQDGMTPAELEPHLHRFAGLFLGGSDDFKESAPFWSAFARANGLGFHWGRATKSRIAGAIAIGSTSADSAHPCRYGPDLWAAFLAEWDDRHAPAAAARAA
jgi:hypothetical protein